MKSHYEDLEERVEYWRWRAEEAEAKLTDRRSAFTSIKPVKGLSPTQTIVMQSLALRDMTTTDLLAELERAGLTTRRATLKVQLSTLRKKLPAEIAPSKAYGWGARHEIPDRPALREWLETGQLPIRRAA